MRSEYKLYINGGWTAQTDGCVREDMEPATGRPLFSVHRAGPGDVERALQNAYEAFPAWSQTMADRREAILLKAADVMASREEEFMELLVREGGKPQSIARGEFRGGVGVFRVAAGALMCVSGQAYSGRTRGASFTSSRKYQKKPVPRR